MTAPIRALTFVLLFVFLPVCRAAAQQPADTVAAPPWKLGLVGRLTASQVGYHNWTEGGVNTLATTAVLEGKAKGMSGPWEQNHEVRLVLGIVKQDTLEVRKAEDLIRIRSSLQYRGDGFFRTINPTLAAEVNTQFASGFNYKRNPFEDGRTPPVKVSDFLAPATFTQSLGLTYDPRPWFTHRMGLGAKETLVALSYYRPLYSLRPDQALKLELGMESQTKFEREVFKNVHVKSLFGLFAAFTQSGPPDMRWENLVAMKVNSWLGVNFEFTTLYDQDMSEAVQIKESLSLAFSFVFV